MTELFRLPPLHRDPFDRLLIAQALHHVLTLVTVDPTVAAYSVPLLSAA
jgi:PIN domain nuclease of toxin-antitoxin system